MSMRYYQCISLVDPFICSLRQMCDIALYYTSECDIGFIIKYNLINYSGKINVVFNFDGDDLWKYNSSFLDVMFGTYCSVI